MNEKHLKLFTKVEEGLPEEDGRYSQEYLLILDGQVSSGCYNFESQRWVQIQGRNEIIIYPSHYLDLSTLTTKSAALELAEDAWKAGINWQRERFSLSYQDFINQNKDRL